MKWQRLFIVAAVALGLAAGCGGDDDGTQIEENQNQNQNQNQENQNQNQNQNQENQNQNQNQENANDEDDPFADAVDVWVGAERENLQTPTELEIGDSFGGRYESDGVHYFMLDLEAGQVVTLSTFDLEEGHDGSEEIAVRFRDYIEERDFAGFLPTREFWPNAHDQREFFVPRTGTFEFEVHSVGGEDRGFAFETSVAELESDGDLEFPGTTDGGDLNDAQVDAHSVNHGEDQSAAIEVFADREPVSSSLDAWLYVFDADAGELVISGTNQGEELPDPLVTADLGADTNYEIVVDMGANVAEAGYQIDSEFIATSETNPQELSLDGEDQFEGQIKEWDDQPYTDYFTVTVEPGDYTKVTVEGDDQLQPTINAAEQTEEDDAFASPPSADAFAVDNTAGVTLGVDDGADGPMTFDLEVTDERNVIEEDLDPYYGGEDFGYTISLEAVDPTPLALSEGTTETVSFAASTGELMPVDLTVTQDQLVWLDGGSDTEIGEDQQIPDLGYIPGWAFGDTTTLATARPFQAYLWSAETEYSLLFRDYFFRGGTTEYETDIRATSLDTEAPDYDSADLIDGNDSTENASALTLPVTLTGEFTNTGEDQEEVEPEVYYFEADLEQGDLLVGHTQNDAIMETQLTVMDQEGNELATSGLYMEQRQQAGEDEDPYYDGAVVYEVEEAGTHWIAVEQYCGFFGCDTGEANVSLFTESTGS